MEPAREWSKEEKEEWLKFMEQNKKAWSAEDRLKWARANRELERGLLQEEIWQQEELRRKKMREHESEEEREAHLLIDYETKEQWDDRDERPPCRHFSSTNVADLHPNEPEPEQKEFRDLLGEMGYPVLVEWEDAIQSDGRWNSFDELSPGTATCLSVGFYLSGGDESCIILPHVIHNSEDADDQYCGEMIIPRSAVRRVWELDSSRRFEVAPIDKKEG